MNTGEREKERELRNEVKEKMREKTHQEEKKGRNFDWRVQDMRLKKWYISRKRKKYTKGNVYKQRWINIRHTGSERLHWK